MNLDFSNKNATNIYIKGTIRQELVITSLVFKCILLLKYSQRSKRKQFTIDSHYANINGDQIDQNHSNLAALTT